MTDYSLEQLEQAAAQPDAQPKSWLTSGNIMLLLGVIAVALVFGYALTQRNITQPTSGPAPDFTLTTLDGANIRLSDLKGQVVVLNFWASWCVPCRDEAPALQATWEAYRDKGVVLLGVAWTDTERGARAFMQEFGQDYPNGLDLGTKLAELYHIQGVPETFIIDQQGHIQRFYMQTVTEGRLSADLDALLAGEKLT